MGSKGKSRQQSRQNSRQQSKEKRGSFWSGGRIALAFTALALIVTVTIVSVMFAGGGTDNGGGIDVAGKTDVGGGTGDKSGTSTLIRPEWIGAGVLEIGSDTISIPTNEVVSGRMLHFAVTTEQGGEENFMAYNLAGETYVRANVCPPCRSVGFSLLGDILVCNSCGTRFSANTGDGISGACRDFPKAAVAYTNSGGNIAMGFDDLVAAYENTEKPGWP